MNLKQAENKLWKIFSEYIRERDGWTCICCGATQKETVIQCGHLISRGRRSTKYDEKNNNAQCRTCNNLHNYYPEIYTKKFIEKYGVKEYNDLVDESKKIKQYKTFEVLKMCELYKEKLKELRQA